MKKFYMENTTAKTAKKESKKKLFQSQTKFNIMIFLIMKIHEEEDIGFNSHN